MNTRIPHWLNFILFVLTFVLSLSIKIDRERPLWHGYGDPPDYIYQSELSLTDKHFYFPERVEGFDPRPFTVPLIYKIANSQPERIIVLQKLLFSLSTFFICFVLFLFLKQVYSKIIFVLFFYLLMSWWNILGWTHMIFSESLSMTFLFFWISSFLLFLHKRSAYTFSLHLLVTLLFSFTRDSWPYVILLFYLLYLAIGIFRDRKVVPYFISMLIFASILFVVQNKSSHVGERYRLPIMNNIVFKVLPNDDHYEWFKEKGMPCAEELKENYVDLENWWDIYPLYKDTAYKEFSDWAVSDGRSIYFEFLLSHPSFLLLQDEKPNDLKKIFSYNLTYIGSFQGYSWISQYIFPLFGAISILLLNVVLLFLFFKEKRDIWLLPTVLIIVFAFNAFLLYTADSLEVERHLFITNIMIQFIGILLVSFILDSKYLEKIIPGFKFIFGNSKPKNL